MYTCLYILSGERFKPVYFIIFMYKDKLIFWHYELQLLCNTRGSRYNFLVPHCRSVDSFTFYYAGIMDWNSLPEWLKSLEKPHRFKIALKKFFIEHLPSS